MGTSNNSWTASKRFKKPTSALKILQINLLFAAIDASRTLFPLLLTAVAIIYLRLLRLSCRDICHNCCQKWAGDCIEESLIAFSPDMHKKDYFTLFQ